MTILSLEECMSAIIDYRGKSPRKTSSGVPLITAKVVKDGRIETPDEFIDAAEYDEWMRRGLPQVGDVVITTEAPLGEVAQLSESRIALAQRLILLRGKPGLLDNSYLKYLLMSDEIQAQLASRASGTTVVGIKQSELRKVTLSLPAIDEQEAIASVLGSLDDKSEQNRRTARSLEELTRATFKAWFVDFDPVKAKAAGAAAFPGMPPAAFAALPHSLSDTPAGPAPTGWPVGTLDDLCVRVLDRVGDDACVHDEPLLDLGRFPVRSLMVAATGAADELTTSRVRFERWDSLFGLVRPYFHKVLLAPFPGITNTSVAVVRAREQFDRCLLALLLSSNEVIAHASQVAHGTKMPVAKWSDVSAYPIALPDRPIREAFDQVVSPLLEPLLSLPAEQAMLAKMRDYLLPRLLSGRVRVRRSRRR